MSGDEKVPVAVLDKVIGISEANNQAYSQIVGVLDELSSHIMDMRRTVNTLSDQVETEQLADVVQSCTKDIKSDVDNVAEIVSYLKSSYYSLWCSGLVKDLTDYLKYSNIEGTDFSKMIVSHLQSPIHSEENKDVVVWVMGVLKAIKKHWGRVLVGFGISIAFIYLNGGRVVLDLITKFVK